MAQEAALLAHDTQKVYLPAQKVQELVRCPHKKNGAAQLIYTA